MYKTINATSIVYNVSTVNITDIEQEYLMLYKIVIEMSCMSNNAEFVHYRDIESAQYVKTYINDIIERTKDGFSTPRLVFYRPVFKEEIEQGLNTSYSRS